MVSHTYRNHLVDQYVNFVYFVCPSVLWIRLCVIFVWFLLKYWSKNGQWPVMCNPQYYAYNKCSNIGSADVTDRKYQWPIFLLNATANPCKVKTLDPKCLHKHRKIAEVSSTTSTKHMKLSNVNSFWLVVCGTTASFVHEWKIVSMQKRMSNSSMQVTTENILYSAMH